MFEISKDDKELEEIFHGEDKPLHPDTVHMTLGGGQKPAGGAKKKPIVSATATSADVMAGKTFTNAVDESWVPAKEPNWMDNLKACVKSVALFGGLSFLLFYWKEAGLMAESIAVPCIAVCTALAGFGCGKNALRGANR